MMEGYSCETLQDFVGKEMGVSDWLEIDQGRIQTFADCTDDQQWIHVDVERCKRESPFAGPIAHGFLTLSLLSSFVEQVGVLPKDASRAINLGLREVRFQAPVPVGSRIRARVTLSEATPKGEGRWMLVVRAQVEIENAETPAMTAELLVMLFR